MFKYLIFSTFLLTAFIDSATARVRFITDTENTAGAVVEDEYKSDGGEVFNNDTKSRCANEGYTITRCDSSSFLADPCPYNYSYYRECCPSEYRNTAAQCEAQGKGLGAYSCGGYYKCE